MNKKTYVAPMMRETVINMSKMICASVAGGGAANDIKWGGSGAGKEAGSRQSSSWEDDEE